MMDMVWERRMAVVAVMVMMMMAVGSSCHSVNPYCGRSVVPIHIGTRRISKMVFPLVIVVMMVILVEPISNHESTVRIFVVLLRRRHGYNCGGGSGGGGGGGWSWYRTYHGGQRPTAWQC
jgi:hypothetical protein